MRWVWCLLISSILITPLLALEGQVLFEDGSPVAHATVSIPGHSGSVLTDRQGRFTWQPDPSVPFELLVVLSYGSYLAPVLIEEIPPGKPLVVRVSAVASSTVTVTSGVSPNIDSPPASGTTSVGRRDLEIRSPARLVHAVEDVPGVSFLSEGHAAVPSIRGLARGRTLLLIDSARVTTERRAGPSATYLDPFFLEAIEVARGPGSVAYGSDAFGGVIHARRRRPEPESPLRVRFAGNLAGGEPYQGAALQISKGFTGGGFLLQSSFRQFDDYDSPLGVVPNSGAKNGSWLVGGDFEWGPGTLSLGLQRDTGRDIGRPRNNSDTVRFFYPREDSTRLTLSYDLGPVGGFNRMTVNGFIGSYRLITDRDRRPAAGQSRTLSESDVKARDFGVRAVAVRPLKRARLEVGFDCNGRFDLRATERTTLFHRADLPVSTREALSIRDANRTDSAVFASAEVLLNRHLSASGGVRLDHVATRNSGGALGFQSTGNSATSGFGALNASVAGLMVTAQVSRGFRDPTLSDRYFQGLTGRGVVTGNPDLKPESSLQVDLAVRYFSGNTRWAFYAYRYRIDDLVERFESGTDLFFFRNRGQARLYGFELEAQWDPRPGLKLDFGAQRARGTSLDDSQALDDVPVHNLSLRVRQQLGEGAYLHMRGALYGRDARPGPTERVTTGYGLVDLGGGWRLDSKVELRFQLKNLFDKDYFISPDRRTVLAPGRSGGVTLTLDF
ncbi:MAG: TonB-dependent receptor [Acidobacteriota bacterium]